MRLGGKRSSAKFWQVVLGVVWIWGGGLVLGSDSLYVGSQSGDTAAEFAYRVVERGPVSVSARVLPSRSRKPLTVGDRFRLELTVKRHRNLKISGPFAESLGAFLVLGTKQRVRYQGDTVVDVQELQLAAFAPGKLMLPRFVVTFADSGELRAIRSESVDIEVKSVLSEKMEDINDLKPQAQFPNLLPLFIALGVGALAGLGYGGWRLQRLLRSRKTEGERLAEPWEEALSALEKLPAREWISAGQVKRFYYAVSEILKRYLARRFGFPAVDETTSEVIQELKRAKVELRDEFADFFRRADMVKYAKLVPELAEMEAVVPTVRSLIERTKVAGASEVGARTEAGPTV